MLNDGIPWPKSQNELVDYLNGLYSPPDEPTEAGYEAAANALWKGALAAFRYMTNVVGATGFQASWAELEFLKHSRNLNCSFAILKADDMLYPQHESPVAKAIRLEGEWLQEVAQKARDRIAEADGHVHPNVLAHWKLLVERAEEEVDDE